jgi:hypothetical protein
VLSASRGAPLRRRAQPLLGPESCGSLSQASRRVGRPEEPQYPSRPSQGSTRATMPGSSCGRLCAFSAILCLLGDEAAVAVLGQQEAALGLSEDVVVKVEPERTAHVWAADAMATPPANRWDAYADRNAGQRAPFDLSTNRQEPKRFRYPSASRFTVKSAGGCGPQR